MRRAQQRLVEGLRAVGGRQHDDALVVVEAVHLGEELVQRLLALVVGRERGVAPLAHGVDLVDEDNAGRLLVGLLEEVAHLGGAAPDEHLDKGRARDLEKRHARLAGDGLGQERLSRARRAHEQGAARAARADLGVLVGVLEEAHDLLERLLGLVLAGHVLERDAGLLALDLLGVGLAEAAPAKAAAKVHRRPVVAHGLLHAAVEPPADAQKYQDRQAVGDEQHEPQVPGGVLDLGDHRDVVALEQLGRLLLAARPLNGLVDLLGVALSGGEGDLGAAHRRLGRGDLALLDHLDELAVVNPLHLRRTQVGVKRLTDREVRDDRDQDVEQHRAAALVVVHVHRVCEPFGQGVLGVSDTQNTDSSQPGLNCTKNRPRYEDGKTALSNRLRLRNDLLCRQRFRRIRLARRTWRRRISVY